MRISLIRFKIPVEYNIQFCLFSITQKKIMNINLISSYFFNVIMAGIFLSCLKFYKKKKKNNSQINKRSYM